MSMNYLVTGVAGFIGSHLARSLLERGGRVTGVDCFTDYYERHLKELNIKDLYYYEGFTFLEKDIAELTPLDAEGTDVVFHQAAQAGVRKSWGGSFDAYTHNNILATQKLLELCRGINLKRFVYASSSSVYGEVEELPVSEGANPRPVSPYGVSKLAAEHLCNLYHYNYGIPSVSLRYFTVYGPGQRPDMAFNIFIRSMLGKNPISVYGDGEQTRDFTFISDAVEANLAAASAPGVEGMVFNIGGGSRVTVNHVIATLEDITGIKARVEYEDPQKGDPRHTFADTSAAKQLLSFTPRADLKASLQKQVTSLQ